MVLFYFLKKRKETKDGGITQQNHACLHHYSILNFVFRFYFCSSNSLIHHLLGLMSRLVGSAISLFHSVSGKYPAKEYIVLLHFSRLYLYIKLASSLSFFVLVHILTCTVSMVSGLL